MVSRTALLRACWLAREQYMNRRPSSRPQISRIHETVSANMTFLLRTNYGKKLNVSVRVVVDCADTHDLNFEIMAETNNVVKTIFYLPFHFTNTAVLYFSLLHHIYSIL